MTLKDRILEYALPKLVEDELQCTTQDATQRSVGPNSLSRKKKGNTASGEQRENNTI